jgi:hypothetical protein
LYPASADVSPGPTRRRSAPPHTRRDPLATRTLSRRALRDQNDEVEAIEDDESEGGDEKPAQKAKKARVRKTPASKDKKPAKPRTRKKATKAPERRVARWAVCDNVMKRIAVFEYKDRAKADAKLAEIRESKAGTFFIQLVKDPYDPPVEPASSPVLPPVLK